MRYIAVFIFIFGWLFHFWILDGCVGECLWLYEMHTKVYRAIETSDEQV